MNPTLRKVLKFVLPILVVAIGIGGAVTLVKSRPEPKRSEKPEMGTLVTTEVASVQSRRIDLKIRGVVQAARSVALQPQVAGNVVWVSEKLVTGGLVSKGDPLIRVEPTDYRLVVEQRETAVAQAEANLRLEEGQQRVAQREWELFKEDMVNSTDSALALREPQRKIAEVNLSAAKSALKKAKIDLSRTTIRAPFNAYVQSESVEPGQRVSQQAVMAQLVGTDVFWVQASMPLDQLPFIAIPGINTDGPGSSVKVIQSAGTRQIERSGQVIRMLGDLDPVGRMARVIVEVPDPFRRNADESGLPILIGAYVQGIVEGKDEASVVVVPRRVVHQGDKIWVLSAENTLEIREVSVAWADEDSVYLSGGIEPGERYVTSRLGTPIAGMRLRAEGGDDE